VSAAYDSLYEVVATPVKLLAPIVPFTAEEIYQKLKWGDRLPCVRAALASAQPSLVATAVRGGQALELQVEGQRISIEPEDVLLESCYKSGLHAAEGASLSNKTGSKTMQIKRYRLPWVFPLCGFDFRPRHYFRNPRSARSVSGVLSGVL
jgi:isoleucyl-tRNA synthetase